MGIATITSLYYNHTRSMTQHEDSYSCRRQSTNTAVRSGGRLTVTRLNTSPGHGVFALGVLLHSSASRARFALADRVSDTLVAQLSERAWRERRCAFESPPSHCLVGLV